MFRCLLFLAPSSLGRLPSRRSTIRSGASVDKAVAEIKAGDFQHAIELFDSISKGQRDVKFYLHRAECWSDLGNDEEALADIAKAVPLQNRWTSAHEVFEIELVRSHIGRPIRERVIATARRHSNSARALDLADAAPARRLAT